jgi:hypothetical protein
MEKGKIKMLYMTQEQQYFLIRYWYFLTPAERIDYLEKILRQINQYIINEIEQIFSNVRDVITECSEQIVLNNSIRGDDITKIFEKMNQLDMINSIDISEKIMEIKNKLIMSKN